MTVESWNPEGQTTHGWRSVHMIQNLPWRKWPRRTVDCQPQNWVSLRMTHSKSTNCDVISWSSPFNRMSTLKPTPVNSHVLRFTVWAKQDWMFHCRALQAMQFGKMVWACQTMYVHWELILSVKNLKTKQLSIKSSRNTWTTTSPFTRMMIMKYHLSRGVACGPIMVCASRTPATTLSRSLLVNCTWPFLLENWVQLPLSSTLKTVLLAAAVVATSEVAVAAQYGWW